MTFSPVMAQPVVPGWHAHWVHVATPETRLHVSPDVQGMGALHPLPTALQVEMPFCWHRVELPTQMSRMHWPLLQNEVAGQSV
jgi:hypothetical protein